MQEIITSERLTKFTESAKEYDYLVHRKENLEAKFKVFDSGDVKFLSSQDCNDPLEQHYLQDLKNINSCIDEYDKWILKEKEIIKLQINRVRQWNYRRLLVLRYIEKWKWSDIIDEFFGFEEDFEEEKEYKYRDRIFYWNRQALAGLEKVSEIPFKKLVVSK